MTYFSCAMHPLVVDFDTQVGVNLKLWCVLLPNISRAPLILKVSFGIDKPYKGKSVRLINILSQLVFRLSSFRLQILPLPISEAKTNSY